MKCCALVFDSYVHRLYPLIPDSNGAICPHDTIPSTVLWMKLRNTHTDYCVHRE